MSFQYARSGPSGEVFLGRVKAIEDGALVLKTNKVKDKSRYCVWSKQCYAISFEAISHTCLRKISPFLTRSYPFLICSLSIRHSILVIRSSLSSLLMSGKESQSGLVSVGKRIWR